MNPARQMTIDGWISRAAEVTPDKPALIFDGEVMSYADMAAAVSARAEGLRGAGIGRGDRVAWYGLNHPEVFVLLFACARIGAILVPLNWRLAAEEVARIVENCAPGLVLHDDHFAQRAKGLQAVPVLHLDDPVPGVTRDLDPTQEAPDQARGGVSDDPVLLVYTSGATGLPKGALLTQAALACNAAHSIEAHDLGPESVVLNVLPLFHVGGLNILPTPAFSLGATVLLHERFEPDAMCAALQQVSHAISVPTVLQAVIDCDGWDSADLSRLRAISIGSTDVPRPLIDAVQARGVPVIQIYGATETCPLAIYQRIGEAMATTGSIGRAGSRCEIKLMCDNIEVSDGAPGEIWVRGANLLREYWNDPELTAAMVTDGWYRTGDVAMRDAAGLYWFTDRIKHVIISGGENIYPAEIERILRELPGVAEVAVVGRPDAKWGEIPVAVVVAEGPLSPEDVLAPLRDRLARYKQPKQVVFARALPRNAMGKVVAEDVRALVADQG